MVVSVFENICKKLTLWKRCSISCCNNYEESKTEEHTHVRAIEAALPISRIDIVDPISCINFEREYVLNTCMITADFYDINDIGQFLTDIDGFCIHINEKGTEHIGERRTKIQFSLMWAFNLYSDDVMDVIREWQESLDHEKVLIYKERRIINNRFVYLIIEAYPIFSKGRFKGMKGIMMRVTKPVWNKFDSKSAKKTLIQMELNKEESLHIPVNIRIVHTRTQ
jgi:hypothetical protein